MQVPASMVAPDVATQAELDAVSSVASAAQAAASQKLAGDVVQVVHSQTSAVSTSVIVMPLDDTIPQITEGTELLTASITPTSASNYLLIEAVLHAANNSASVTNMAALFQDSTANALAAGVTAAASNSVFPTIIRHRMLAGTTSATTFRLRVGPSSAVTMTINGTGGARLLGGVLVTSLTVTEIKA